MLRVIQFIALFIIITTKKKYIANEAVFIFNLEMNFNLRKCDLHTAALADGP